MLIVKEKKEEKIAIVVLEGRHCLMAEYENFHCMIAKRHQRRETTNSAVSFPNR